MMLKIISFLLVLFVFSEARYHRYFNSESDLTETKWMDRKITGNSARITNGSPATIADFPYMLAMIDVARGGFVCGASVIALHWSLSAAHCTDFGTPWHLINLRGGSTNRGSGGTIFFVQQYWNHPLFGDPNNARRLAYDIVILRTRSDSPIQGTNVARVPLPPNCSNNVCCGICGGTNVLIAGWGRTETGASSQTLRQMSAPVMSLAECDRIWGRMGPSFFCITIVNGRDVCSGDSGSPLVTGTGSSRVQHGVVSFGSATCGDSIPSVHIRIEHPVIRDWIRGHSGV